MTVEPTPPEGGEGERAPRPKPADLSGVYEKLGIVPHILEEKTVGAPKAAKRKVDGVKPKKAAATKPPKEAKPTWLPTTEALPKPLASRDKDNPADVARDVAKGVTSFFRAPSHKAFVVWSALAIVALTVALSWWDNAGGPTSLGQSDAERVAARLYTDDELGISFAVPERWGTPRSSTRYSFTQAIKEYTFPGESSVRLYAISEHYESLPWLQDAGLYAVGDPHVACEAFQRIRRRPGEEEERSSGGEDIFRPGGAYAFGNCTKYPPRINVAVKSSDAEKQTWIPVEEGDRPGSTIGLSHSIFFRTVNPVFKAVTLKATLPDIETDGVCLKREGIDSRESRMFKSYRCLNYAERNTIDEAFAAFGASRLADEMKTVAGTFAFRSSAGSDREFARRFESFVPYVSDELGLRFEYPAILPAPDYDAETREIAFSGATDREFVVRVTTKEDAVADERRSDACETCLRPLVDPELWRREKEIAETSPLGPVKCPATRSLLGSYGRACEVQTLNGMRTLVRYYSGHTTGGKIEKNYVLYPSANRRLDLLIRSDSAAVADVGEFKELEAEDLTLTVAGEIAGSVRMVQ